MNYIFLFSLGPVQSFLAQARKTQDLYGGSRLLSHLCRVALKKAIEQGIEPVFPAVEKVDNSDAALPNRFVGLLENAERFDLKAVGKSIEDAVKVEWKKIADDEVEDLVVISRADFDAQIERHLDIHWLFAPVEGEYTTSYANAERSFVAMKNTRHFSQSTEPAGRKCSMDGERNVLFYKCSEGESLTDAHFKLFDDRKTVSIFQGDKEVPLKKLQPGEGLSGVSFVKRSFREKGKSEEFPSTAAIALSVWLEENSSRDDYKTFKSLFNGGFDEQLCYKENITSKYLRKNGLGYILSKMEKWDTLKKLHNDIFGEKELPKYYALVAFDGDEMGKIVSGVFLKDKSRLREFQNKVSGLLRNYAQWASAYVNEEPRGKTVYAGGDDFLGFVNLAHLFETIGQLRDEFREQVNKPLCDAFKEELMKDFEFTFSAGIAIAHYKIPLSIVVKKAKEMEEKAKNGGRDAFAIAVLKHSGESHETALKWSRLLDVQHILAELEEKKFSANFIRAFQQEFFRSNHGERSAFFLKSNPAIVESEIQRLLRRAKSKIPGVFANKEAEERAISETAAYVMHLLLDSPDYNNFTETLNIITFHQIKNEPLEYVTED
ncbi:MAG: hypothetical protein EPGJADBJ_05132 [Saprospiraceae bacterium]|nr:hypothetical protein [Saprospiraceae bacterium]